MQGNGRIIGLSPRRSTKWLRLGGGESVSQSSLEIIAFSSFPEKNLPFTLRIKRTLPQTKPIHQWSLIDNNAVSNSISLGNVVRRKKAHSGSWRSVSRASDNFMRRLAACILRR